jgi:hypothetical protein
MGLLQTLGAMAENTPAGLVTSAVSTVLDHILPESQASKDAADAMRAAAAEKIMELQAAGTFEQKAELQLAAAQIGVNQAEAAQPGTHFRDGAGWVCVAGFALIVVRPLVEWGAVIAGHPLTLPAIDTAEIYPMLGALLGLGTMHTVQAVKAAA